VHRFAPMKFLLATGFLVLVFLGRGWAGEGDAPIGKSVVRIEATSQSSNYRMPWTPGQIGSGVGSGFVIPGNRIMTNAHVVSNARFLTVSKQGDPKPYPARVEHIAHDCDLAILTVNDSSFFEGMRPLALGGIPQIESTVSAYGYPIGGDRLSVTRGVVSRIDFQPYSHSGADSHLAIQIDAAINPGNSGGPVLQEGKVVGVAFQGFRGDVAQNVGYMIPTPVIRRFLEDVRDGQYDHYMDLSLTYFPLFNPAARSALGLKNPDGGVLVGTVFGGGTVDGTLQRGDVLLSIDGFPIASDGSVELDAENVELAEVVERKFLGDSVRLEFLREGKVHEVELDLKPFPFRLIARNYDERPRFVTFGGLVFQPVDLELMLAFNPGDFRLRFLFDSFLSDHRYRERPEIVVLSSILSDPVNSHLSDFRFSVVDKINGNPIRDLSDVAAALADPEEFTVIEFLGQPRPAVLPRDAVIEASGRISNRYGMSATQNLDP
jgi:S1-C subfamily serine protease